MQAIFPATSQIALKAAVTLPEHQNENTFTGGAGNPARSNLPRPGGRETMIRSLKKDRTGPNFRIVDSSGSDVHSPNRVPFIQSKLGVDFARHGRSME